MILAYSWCEQCNFFQMCYEGGYPHFLEPRCSENPDDIFEETKDDTCGSDDENSGAATAI